MREAGGTLADGLAIGAAPTGSRPRRPVDAQTVAPSIGTLDVADPAPPIVERAEVHASPHRRALVTFALGFVALVGLYFETVLDLWEGWGKTGTYAHGYFIFPIAAWLVWRSRARLADIAPVAQPWALLPLAGCGLLWLAAHSAGVHAPEQYAFVGMVPCLVWAVFGNAVTRRILYPLAFLFFAVPAGDFLMPTLMDHTADFTVAALRLSGVPVFREGNYFSIPSGNWSVVEACSGLRYLIASITLGVLFAYLNYRAAWRRAAFILAALLVPIVANWLRAYMIVMLAHLSSNKLATGVDHLIYGWLFFGLVMMLLFWVGNFWRDDDDAEMAIAPVIATRERSPVRRASPRAIAAMAAGVIAVAAPWPALAALVERIADRPVPGPIALDSVPGWQAAEPFTTFVPHYVHARSTENRTFGAADHRVGLFVAYYSGQLDNGLLITYENDVVLTIDKLWGSIAQRTRTVATGERDLTVVENEVKGDTVRGNERLMTWRWYWINGRWTTSPYVAKAYTAIDKLTGRGDDSAVVVLTTPMTDPSGADARAALTAFTTTLIPPLTTRLAAVHDEARR